MKRFFKQWMVALMALCIGVCAVYTPAGAEEKRAVVILDCGTRTTVLPGEEWEMTICVSDLPDTGWGALTLKLSYPGDTLTYVRSSVGPAMAGTMAVVNTDQNPLVISAISLNPCTTNGVLYRFWFRVNEAVALGTDIAVRLSIDEFKQTVSDGHGGMSFVDVISPQQLTTVLTVKKPEITDLQMVQLPHKLNYRLNTPLDLSGMVVQAWYSDGTMRRIPNNQLEIEGYRDTDLGAQSVVVMYQGKKLPPITVKIREFLYGDLNNDGTVDSMDALLVLEHDTDLRLLPENMYAFADVNDDGIVDSLDALEILQYDAEITNEMPVEKNI